MLTVLAPCAHAQDAGPSVAPATIEPAPKCTQRPCVVRMDIQGEIVPPMAMAFADNFGTALQIKADGVLLVIDSIGGWYTAAVSMIRIIHESPIPVFCLVHGDADSAAFWLLQACSDRAATPVSELMIHESGLYRENGTCARRTAQQLENDAAELRVMDRTMAQQIGPRLGMTPENFAIRIANVDWFMDVPAAIKTHALDRAVPTIDYYRGLIYTYLQERLQHVRP